MQLVRIVNLSFWFLRVRSQSLEIIGPRIATFRRQLRKSLPSRIRRLLGHNSPPRPPKDRRRGQAGTAVNCSGNGELPRPAPWVKILADDKLEQDQQRADEQGKAPLSRFDASPSCKRHSY